MRVEVKYRSYIPISYRLFHLLAHHSHVYRSFSSWSHHDDNTTSLHNPPRKSRTPNPNHTTSSTHPQGETEWSLNGRHTGTSDIPLTANGEKRIRATGKALVGDDRLIVPKNLAHIYVSPRKRAQRTLELLGLGCPDPIPWQQHGKVEDVDTRATKAKVEVTEGIREWDYGEYEGVTSKEIQARRRERGKGEWDIWRDGCPGGE